MWMVTVAKIGTFRNYGEAVSWYRKAADGGNAAVQYNVTYDKCGRKGRYAVARLIEQRDGYVKQSVQNAIICGSRQENE
jgi:TPR repeat protein